MRGTYTIEADPARGMIIMRLGGFFAAQDVEQYIAEKAVAIASLRCAPNQHLTLCDVSECKIQTQDMVAMFSGTINDPATMSRRIAIVVGTSLAKMQVRRMLTRDDARCFEDRQSAEAWLLAA